MKIGFSKTPVSPAGTYFQHLARILARQAPEHEYIVGGDIRRGVDLYHFHGARPELRSALRSGRMKSVVTVPNLNFLRYPGLYSLSERAVLLRAYRRALRRAGRVITVDSPAREELSERLQIPRSRIEVVLPLTALVPREEPSRDALEAVRHKYGLPGEFVLMLGTVEPRHNHEALLRALFDTHLSCGAVICGRRTSYSDRLLGYLRERHMARRVEFIYELSPEDLPALFRLARLFAYLPDAQAGASIVPVVESLRARLPMLLSDTPANREAAGDAGVYVRPEVPGEVSAALLNLAQDESFRREMQQRESRRAELFSEYAVARRLIDIYTSL